MLIPALMIPMIESNQPMPAAKPTLDYAPRQRGVALLATLILTTRGDADSRQYFLSSSD